MSAVPIQTLTVPGARPAVPGLTAPAPGQPLAVSSPMPAVPDPQPALPGVVPYRALAASRPAPAVPRTPPVEPVAVGRAEAALGVLLDRVAATHREVGDLIPIFSDPAGGWTTSRRGSWVGGFWVGLLRLRATVTGDPAVVRAAAAAVDRLRDRLADDTVTRAMTFWYGVAAGAGSPPAQTSATRTGGSPAAGAPGARHAGADRARTDEVYGSLTGGALTSGAGEALAGGPLSGRAGEALAGGPLNGAGEALAGGAAVALAGSVDAVTGLVPDGAALGLGPAGRRQSSVDSLGALVRLLCWADTRWAGAARPAVRATPVPALLPVVPRSTGAAPSTAARRLARGQLDGFVAAAVGGAAEGLPVQLRWDGPGRPVAVASGGWARGEAWALLAAVDGYVALGPAYRRLAERAADDWLRRHRDRVPADRPGGPVDTSAAAVAALALRKLAALPDAPVRYADGADRLLARLIGDWLDDHGVLHGGCYQLRPGVRAQVETVWGSYFLAVALAAATGLVSPLAY